MDRIDFVIMWVDGSDENWIREKLKYQSQTTVPDEKAAEAAKCFRDWGILQYWFRAVEKYAPWVRRIHFVTWGHLPAWLNTENPKLQIVRHQDFMPEGSLPTFNSRALELNLHRIPGLAEQFVYFNDDMFLTSVVKETDFFRKKLPCDCAILSPVIPDRYGTAAIQMNDLEIVNDYFGGFRAVISHPGLWLSPRYGKQLLRMPLMLPFRTLNGVYEPHLPASYLKSVYQQVWEKEEEVLMHTTMCRFKRKDNVNQWLFRYWQLASGNFIPRSPETGKYYDLGGNVNEICKAIYGQKRKIICINDSSSISDIETVKKAVTAAFQAILPEQSSFEITEGR